MCGVVHSCQHNYLGARRERCLADQLRHPSWPLSSLPPFRTISPRIVADASLSDLDDLAGHLLVTHSVSPSF
jgi:hypothetical protein